VLRDFGAGGIRIGRAAVAAGMADRDGALEDTIAKLAGGARPESRRMGMSDKMVTLKDGERVVTAAEFDELKAQATKVADQAGYERGLAEGLAKGRTEGKEAGAKEERERILAIEEAAIPGCEDLVAEMKRDGTTTAGEAALKINAAFRAKPEKDREAALAALRKADQPVEPAPSPTGAVDRPALSAGAIDEVTARRQWDQNVKHPKTGNPVQSEFVTFADFFAFTKHERGVRILDKRAS
jgi:capsid assembly protease